MKDNNAVEIKNVTKSFKIKASSGKQKYKPSTEITKKSKNNIVLDDVSVDIRRGEVVGIIGRNGSGKSTLLKLISQIMEPDSGTIEVRGAIASILELGMGFHGDMTGRENIYIKGSMYGFSKGQIEERMDDIIEYSNLGDYIDNPLKTYSSGMTGRLAFAIMIHVNADIFLVDEILSIGDVSFSAKAAQHFRNIAKSGKTVLFVSHSLGTIEEMCSRAIWIEGGKIQEDGSAKRVCDNYRREMIESFDITSELAESGVIDAQYRLAKMYLEGSKVGKDEVVACEWMKKAAESRHVQAQVEYADMLLEGTGTEQDTTSAIFYYQAAADRGNNDARVKVSTLIGKEDDKDRTEIREMFREIANMGNPLNEYRYGDLLLKTAWGDRDREEAFTWFSRSANNGNLEATCQKAIMLRDGIGTPVDVGLAVDTFRKAAAVGHQKSQNLLASLLLSGTKIEKDETEAFKWHLKAAESGNAKSQYQVAVMYREGIGVEEDVNESKKWFNIFSNSSIVNHQLTMAEILKNVNLSDKYTSEKLLLKASDSYNSLAMYRLGIMHRDRLDSDMNTAIKWLLSAAERCNIQAQVALGDILIKGIGVEKDVTKAFNYYLMAAINGSATAAYRVAMMYKDGVGVEQNAECHDTFLKIATEGGNADAILETNHNSR